MVVSIRYSTIKKTSSAMVVSIRYSTIKKKKAARIEYAAIRVTSFVSIVVYLTCTIMLKFIK